MKITSSNFMDVLGKRNIQYQIPIYQRNYAWGTEQCERLIKDIIKAGKPGNPSHFIGSVIVKEELSTTAVNISNVIDGQQRLTSISLLLLALKEYCKNPSAIVKDPTIRCAINGIFDDCLINATFNSTSFYYKLQPKDGNDLKEYNNLLMGILGSGRLTRNYQLFLKYMLDNKTTPDFVYMGIKNAQLALVSLDPPDNPQLLFEAVNDTGVDLTEVDLVRNWIFMGLTNAEQKKLYKKYWEPMENKVKDMNQFLHYYIEMKAEGVIGNAYYSIFRKIFILNVTSFSSVESLLEDILYYSNIYDNFINSSFKNKKVNDQLNNIKHANQNLFTPVILLVMNNNLKGSLSIDDTLSILCHFESYLIRRDILRIPTNTLGKAMVSMLRCCSSKKAFDDCLSSLPYRQRNPSDDELRNQMKILDFYHLSNAYYYLFRIEKSQNSAFSLDDPTIEHILPETMHTTDFPKTNVKNPSDYNWELDLGPYAKAIHSVYQHTLGNLTILPRAENSKMGDLRFDKKKDFPSKAGDGFNYGYKFTPIRISQSLKDYSKWDETSILDRTKKLCDIICKIWPRP